MSRRDLYAAVMAAVLVLAALLVLAPQAATHATTPRPAQPVPGLVPWPSPAAASRTAPGAMGLPTLHGAPFNGGVPPLDPAGVQDAKRRVPAVPRPTAQPSAAPKPHASPRGTPRAARAPRVVASGLASFMAPSYGPSYLALPSGPGHRVLICSMDRCITRTSTDAGPDLAMQRAGRVADLSFADMRYLCGCQPYVVGLISVEVRAR